MITCILEFLSILKNIACTRTEKNPMKILRLIYFISMSLLRKSRDSDWYQLVKTTLKRNEFYAIPRKIVWTLGTSKDLALILVSPKTKRRDILCGCHIVCSTAWLVTHIMARLVSNAAYIYTMSMCFFILLEYLRFQPDFRRLESANRCKRQLQKEQNDSEQLYGLF